MLKFKRCKDEQSGEEWIETNLSGKPLLTTPQLNKGTAFSEAEREIFNIKGKLPPRVESLDEQVARAYLQFKTFKGNLKKNIFLNSLLDKNQVLFYKLVSEHLVEMLPTLYTPIVGTAVKEFSHEFRQARGLYLTHNDKDNLVELLNNRSNPEIDLIVVSDGEGVLGIGDQGIGGIDIPVAKLMVYTLFGGIDPNRTLPILLDVGTNNQGLLDDPYYLGCRHPRIPEAQYDEFIATFVDAIKTVFPKTFLHWEDIGRRNAYKILKQYRNQICTFNDDIQGTGLVTLAALLAAVKSKKETIADQRIVIFGAGTAGMGITEQIAMALEFEGLNEQEVRDHFYLIDRPGLLLDNMPELTEAQKPFARDHKHTQNMDLLQVIEHIKPTVLIGASTVTGAFNEKVVKTMAKHCERPIIFPLSNPTEKSEATPTDLIHWTNNQAIIALGSPFDPVDYNGEQIPIAQSNNALAFPGIGLGIIACQAKRLTDSMIWAACNALAEIAPIMKDPTKGPLPNVSEGQAVSQHVAHALCEQAFKEGEATAPSTTPITELIKQVTWEAKYIPFKKSS